MSFRNGLASLLRPEDAVLVLIDHQPYQLANVNSHEPQMVINNTAGLAKAARACDVPTILTSVVAERGGLLFPQITDVFPGQKVIDRTFINTWQDRKVVDAVKATGRKQLVIAGLWTEVCVAMPAIQALGEGWDVTVVTDASGAVSVEAHEVAGAGGGVCGRGRGGGGAPVRRARGRRLERPGRGGRMAARLGPDRTGRQTDGGGHAACRRQRHRVSVGATVAQHARAEHPSLISSGMTRTTRDAPRELTFVEPRHSPPYESRPCYPAHALRIRECTA